jgi:enediyne biosynthesis protein E4
MTFQYFYNGGGVAVGDINNDGLEDLYFSGNMVSNKLYLNRGNFKFQDITLATNTGGRQDGWATGVSMVDINQDGLMDIYVCYSGDYPAGQRKNQLFVNQGLDEDGIPYYKESASDYGLDDSGYSTSSVFFDYDLDGDLDMLLLQHNPRLFSNLDENQFKKWLSEEEPEMHSKLYRNDNGKYTDVTKSAGLAVNPLSYGLGAGVSDLNGDGFPDIYIGNDYSSPDYLYINNGDGTFSDQSKKSLGHTSLYTMGLDIADYNNDGHVDIFTLDMLPEDNKRQKLLFSPENYDHFDLLVNVGLHHQYMRNMLQLNNGEGTFSEIGQLAGVSNTDWSWAPLFADFDNDGHKDLFVSNGFLKDFTNLDFINYRNEYLQNQKVSQAGIVDLISKMPATPLKNYMFENQGNLQFSNKSDAWGLDQVSNSNGAVYVDLDNDGDLDLVVNNINEPAFVYQNQSRELFGSSYLQVALEGEGGNKSGFGTKVKLYSGGKVQMLEQQPYRGYQGNVSHVLHFGLDKESKIDSIQVIWSGNSIQTILSPEINSRIKIQKSTSIQSEKPVIQTPLWSAIATKGLPSTGSKYFRDFNRQGQLMEALSAKGGKIYTADIDGDGSEEVFFIGGMGQEIFQISALSNGNYKHSPVFADLLPTNSNIVDLQFFDMDNDGDLDLYLVSGGYHDFESEDERLKDILLVNDGNGNFQKSSLLDFQPIAHSGSTVASLDVNGDGFLDLVIGGYYKPGRFPESDKTLLLLNQNGKGFKYESDESLEDLTRVTAIRAVDLDADGKPELVIASEWSAIQVLGLDQHKLINVTEKFIPNGEKGLWKSLLVEDLDGDGVPEILAGNHGLNSQYKASQAEPMTMHYADFDQNGSVDPILSYYIQGKPQVYLSRDELTRQLYRKKALFPSYGQYAEANLEAILSEDELKQAKRLSVNSLETSLYMSESGKYKKVALPLEAQFAPVYSAIALPSGKEGKSKDLLLAGNQLQARMKIGRMDANRGVLLRTSGKADQFRALPQNCQGLISLEMSGVWYSYKENYGLALMDYRLRFI